MIDVDQAMVNPSSVFDAPDAVCHSADLSREQKIDILRRWALDERAMQVAEDENMAAPRPTSSRLDEILKVLHAMGEEFHPA